MGLRRGPGMFLLQSPESVTCAAESIEVLWLGRNQVYNPGPECSCSSSGCSRLSTELAHKQSAAAPTSTEWLQGETCMKSHSTQVCLKPAVLPVLPQKQQHIKKNGIQPGKQVVHDPH